MNSFYNVFFHFFLFVHLGLMLPNILLFNVFFNVAIYLNIHYLFFNLKSVVFLPCNAAAFINTYIYIYMSVFPSLYFRCF